MTADPKVSVIVPIYNVEKYIEKCLINLFEQTLPDIELIFINDATPDQSMDILKRVLERYPEKKSRVKIINHKMNIGVSASRQEGVDAAEGEYIIHCDTDDWPEVNMYEELYNEAQRTDADIVGCNFVVHESGDKQRIRYQDFNLRGEEAVSEMLEGRFHAGLWCRLIKRELIANTKQKFHPGINMMEDLLYLLPLHLATNKVAYVKKVLYNYRLVGNSLTHTRTQSQMDSSIYVINQLRQYLEGMKNVERVFEKFVAKITLPLITDTEIFDPVRWRELNIHTSPNLYNSKKNVLVASMAKVHLDAILLRLLKRYRKKDEK